MNKSKCFAILANKTPDIIRIEQLSLCICYVNSEENKICENFLMFVPAIDVTGQCLANLIVSNLNYLKKIVRYSLVRDTAGQQQCVHLHYAQAYKQQEYPMALYVHCSAHSLNLLWHIRVLPKLSDIV